MSTRLALFVALTATLLPATARVGGATEETRKMIAILQSDASLFDKARACQQLGEIGNRDAVPALAAMLADPHLNAYARSGLEGIPDPGAAAALRQAAVTLKGPLLAGVLNSLGALRDTQAVELLARLATDTNSGVSKEALLALGNISSRQSIRILQRALSKGPEAFRADAAAACLLAADRQRLAGDPNKALVIYNSLRNGNVPMTFRIGATRGAILAHQNGRVPFLIKQLRSGELPVRDAALLTIREIPDDQLAAALNAELKHATTELQCQILLALVDCHNPQSIPAVAILAQSPNPKLRKTALTVLGRLGPDAAPALLAALQEPQTGEDKSVILSGLKALRGPSVDDLLLQALASARKPATRIDLIRLLESRGVMKSAPEILRQASGPDREISIVALSALKSLAGSNELSALIVLTKSCADGAVRDAAEITLAGVCSRSGEGDSAAEAILADLKQAATPAERNSWIRVLANVGYSNALPFIEAAASDPDQTVADNALAQLGRWPNPSPIETLLRCVDTAESPALRQRALASVLDLAATTADEAESADATIVLWLQRVTTAAQSIGDKKRILGLLGRLNTPASLRLLTPYLENPILRREAASAIIQIAPALAKGENSGALKSALEEIAAAEDLTNLRVRALQVAKTIPSQAAPGSLFDGRSLAGWEGDTNVWRVRDNVIVGGSMNGNPKNEFLATARSYTNFLLRLEYKLVGTEGFINSGVQFRSMRMGNPTNEMNGYQADIGAGHSGCLYDESRRGKFLARATDETIKRLERPGEWNLYEVRGEGAHIQIWLNGEQTVDFVESDSTIPQTGLIGLQIHGGSKAEVSFRNLRLQELYVSH
ncbi:MAG TPA: family 16 glycoside hydrolase [Candidatus Acidoferrum sp.]|jgi:HEAT repeat protein|nr:family 16 glycoside hydrolase [Candidatus Acidoferrum sp.]